MLLPWPMMARVGSHQRGTQIVSGPCGSMLPDCLKEHPSAAPSRVLPDLNCRVRVSCDMGAVDALVTNVTIKVERCCILEWTSVFSDGSRTVSCGPRSQTETNPKKWHTLGIYL